MSNDMSSAPLNNVSPGAVPTTAHPLGHVPYDVRQANKIQFKKLEQQQDNLRTMQLDDVSKTDTGVVPIDTAGQYDGNYVLQDYTRQLMLLDRQNEKRQTMALREPSLPPSQPQKLDFASDVGVGKQSQPVRQKPGILPSLEAYQTQLEILEQQNQQRLCRARGKYTREPKKQLYETACGIVDITVSPPANKPETTVLDDYNRSSDISSAKAGIDQVTRPVLSGPKAENERIAADNRSPHDMNGWPDQNMLSTLVQSQNITPATSINDNWLTNSRSPHDMNAIPDRKLPLHDNPITPTRVDSLRTSNGAAAGIHALQRQQRGLSQACRYMQGGKSQPPQFAPASFEYPSDRPAYTLHRCDNDIAVSSYIGTAGEPQSLHSAPASFEYSSKALTSETSRESGVLQNSKHGSLEAVEQAILDRPEERKMVNKFKRDSPEVVAQLKRHFRQRQFRSTSPPHKRSMRVRRRAGCSGITTGSPASTMSPFEPIHPQEKTQLACANISLHEEVSLEIRLHIE